MRLAGGRLLPLVLALGTLTPATIARSAPVVGTRTVITGTMTVNRCPVQRTPIGACTGPLTLGSIPEDGSSHDLCLWDGVGCTLTRWGERDPGYVNPATIDVTGCGSWSVYWPGGHPYTSAIRAWIHDPDNPRSVRWGEGYMHAEFLSHVGLRDYWSLDVYWIGAEYSRASGGLTGQSAELFASGVLSAVADCSAGSKVRTFDFIMEGNAVLRTD